MRQPIRISLLLSATTLFAAACTNMPMDGQSSGYNTGYTSPVAATTTNRVPEAGPLSDPAPAANAPAANTYAAAPAAAPVPAATAPQRPVPVATAPQRPVPVATVPQVPAATSAPVATNTGSPYDVYAASTTNSAPVANYTAPVVDYSQQQAQPQTQPQASYNDSYTSYGPVNTPAANTNTYAATNTTYDTYTNNSYSASAGSNTGASYSNASGGSAVQVFATGSAAKAERIRQDMQSQGLPAVVDQVSGLYKVRVPYPDEGTARANLVRVRQASGESGAFVTTR